MSIQSEITRISDAKSTLSNWLTEQNVETEEGANLTSIANTIATLSLKSGSGITELTENFNIWDIETGLYWVAPNVTMTNYTTYYSSYDSALGISESTSSATYTTMLAKSLLEVLHYVDADSGAGLVNFQLLTMNEIPAQLSGMCYYANGTYMGLTVNGGDAMLYSKLKAKQDALVSGTNIKTINGTSLLGSGNVLVQSALVSGTNIKTINGEPILGSGDISVGRQLTEIDGTFSIGALTDGVYLIRQGSVINEEYTIQNDTMGQVISYGTYKALLTVEGNTTWSNEPRNMKYTYDTTTSKIISVSVTSIHDSASINYVNNHTEVYNITGEATDVATATATTIATLTIPAGNYIVDAHVNFASNATGVRKIYIGTQEDYYSNTRGLADNRRASSHQATMSNISTILKVETDTTYYLNVYQNSGSTLSCAGGIRAMRIGDYKEYQAGL